MRYGIFAVSPVSDSSEAERRQANRASSSAILVIVILSAEKDLIRHHAWQNTRSFDPASPIF
jgi:hypothetical protein